MKKGNIIQGVGGIRAGHHNCMVSKYPFHIRNWGRQGGTDHPLLWFGEGGIGSGKRTSSRYGKARHGGSTAGRDAQFRAVAFHVQETLQWARMTGHVSIVYVIRVVYVLMVGVRGTSRDRSDSCWGRSFCQLVGSLMLASPAMFRSIKPNLHILHLMSC